MVSNCNLGKLTGIVRLESEINNGVRVGNWVKLYADALGQRNYNEVNLMVDNAIIAIQTKKEKLEKRKYKKQNVLVII